MQVPVMTSVSADNITMSGTRLKLSLIIFAGTKAPLQEIRAIPHIFASAHPAAYKVTKTLKNQQKTQKMYNNSSYSKEVAPRHRNRL